MTTRKHAFYGILSLVSLFGLGITHSARANLITNDGFETGDFTGWNLSGNTGNTSVCPGCQHSGSYGAALAAVGSEGFITQSLTTVPGGDYTLSFWLGNGTRGPNSFEVSWNGTVVFSLTTQFSNNYSYFTVTGLLATTGSTDLEFGFRQDSTYWLLDDVSIDGPSSVPDAGSSMMLLGIGLAGGAGCGANCAAKVLVVS
jgi:hypothetical protein